MTVVCYSSADLVQYF